MPLSVFISGDFELPNPTQPNPTQLPPPSITTVLILNTFSPPPVHPPKGMLNFARDVPPPGPFNQRGRIRIKCRRPSRPPLQTMGAAPVRGVSPPAPRRSRLPRLLR